MDLDARASGEAAVFNTKSTKSTKDTKSTKRSEAGRLAAVSAAPW